MKGCCCHVTEVHILTPLHALVSLLSNVCCAVCLRGQQNIPSLASLCDSQEIQPVVNIAVTNRCNDTTFQDEH